MVEARDFALVVKSFMSEITSVLNLFSNYHQQQTGVLKKCLLSTVACVS